MPEIFQNDFMIRSFFAGTIIGITAPIIGSFLVVRRLSLIADTLSHVALVGVAIGVLTKSQPVLFAVIVSILGAIGIEIIREKNKAFSESVLALFLSSGLAIVVVIMSIADGFNVNLLNYLFGSITTVSRSDVVVISILGVTAIGIIALLYKEFFFISFHEDLAKASGMKVRIFNLIMIALAGAIIAVSIRIVGALLIGALMVIPVTTAIQFGYGFRKTIVLSILFSLTSVLLGLFASYYLDIASGGAIVLTSLGFFLTSLLVNRK